MFLHQSEHIIYWIQYSDRLLFKVQKSYSKVLLDEGQIVILKDGSIGKIVVL